MYAIRIFIPIFLLLFFFFGPTVLILALMDKHQEYFVLYDGHEYIISLLCVSVFSIISLIKKDEKTGERKDAWAAVIVVIAFGYIIFNNASLYIEKLHLYYFEEDRIVERYETIEEIHFYNAKTDWEAFKFKSLENEIRVHGRFVHATDIKEKDLVKVRFLLDKQDRVVTVLNIKPKNEDWVFKPKEE